MERTNHIAVPIGRVRVAASMRARLRGLLGCSPHRDVLLLAPCHDVHTVGMRRRVDVAFVGADGTVVRSCRSVGPRRRLACVGSVAVLERVADDEAPWAAVGDRLVLAIDRTRKDG